MYKDLIKRIAAELASRQIPYMIIGGQAVLLYGEARLTKDIDITLGMGVEKLPIIKAAAKALNLTIETDEVDAFVRDTMVLPVSEAKTGIRVDFVFSFTPYERQAIERAPEVKFDDVPIRFAALEDVVIHKVFAGRARDIEDIKIILLKNPGYKKDYIRVWLADFDTALEGEFLQKFEEIVSDLARESAKKLARLGGTAKKLRPIPRRRSEP
ncbi:MAG: nucleotidyltransferase [Acidobacteria bacterium]|nr:nucleotidyltransferase [Acidobacteriota bacterium]